MTHTWPGPLSQPLYAVLFDADPVARAGEVAAMFAQQKSAAEIVHLLGVIQEELDHPTQEVRTIHASPQSEAACRAFLLEFVLQLRRLTA